VHREQRREYLQPCECVDLVLSLEVAVDQNGAPIAAAVLVLRGLH
jgi:hypothetical protein